MDWTEPPLPTSISALRPSGMIADRVLRTESGTLWPTDDFIAAISALTELHADGAENWERAADSLRKMRTQVNAPKPSGAEIVRILDAAASTQHRADLLAKATDAMWSTRREIRAIITDAHAALDNGADEDAVVDAAHHACIEANTKGCDALRAAFAEVLS